MKGNWYENSMPKVKDVTASVTKIVEQIKNTEGINRVYVWGSYADNINTPNARIKDVDLLIDASFHAEDLISIESYIIKQSRNDTDLEDEGFDPASVKFSKKVASINSPLMDCWVISKDKKLVHWGPIFTNKIESDSLKKDAEEYADNHTGINAKRIISASDNKRKNWYSLYRDYYDKQISDMPEGWYQSEEKDIKGILNNVIELP